MAGVAKFFLGVMLAIAILFFSGVTAARYLINRLTAPPPRPVFPNDNPMPSPAEAASPSPTAEATPAPSPEAAAPEPSPSPTGTLARVTQPIGLVLRSEPTQASDPLGGIEFNREVEVLETSPDGEWLRIRIPASGQEGWIKSGNTETIQ